jgi:hypothetical protein
MVDELLLQERPVGAPLQNFDEKPNARPYGG